MTDLEKRQQRIQSKIDLEDAEANLVHLQVRANRYADAIDALTKKLRKNAGLGPSRDDSDIKSELETRLSPEEFGLLKSGGDTVAAMIAELRQERQKVFRLREQDALLTRVSG
jgi:hypothetical protein